ncbi:hypothetical protein L1987_17624 [Smallanthus sonchifolius]|uniref:Uncharacterized protein n=1 Tax=Smallanthus sonchifolius TaxID=185202 RepID=A0ACB9IZN2_9ASTR|nr:hypothetical protein L1987_17624 [Smallanthus sonchifolius]
METGNDEQPSKSIYKSGWSDDNYLQEARQLYINDAANKTSAPFTYEHVWLVVKDHDVNDNGIQVQQVPTRPIGRDEAKAEAQAKAKPKLTEDGDGTEEDGNEAEKIGDARAETSLH